MPLSRPTARQHVHTRRIECLGYRREDGLWDIEGHLVDQKTYSFEHDERGTVHSGQPIHEMWLRLTIDEDFLVHDSEAVTDFGPYRICGDITPNFAKLKGIKIGPGWRRKVHDIVGGVKGCTHLVELLSPMATTAYQTLWPIIRKRGGQRSDGPPMVLNTCHAYAGDSKIVQRYWPNFYTGN